MPTYQFHPCLLEGEYLSINEVNFNNASFCIRFRWAADWLSICTESLSKYAPSTVDQCLFTCLKNKIYLNTLMY